MTDEYLLRLRGVTKLFPGVKALDRVEMNLRRGEVLALIGENGAGKSTLINCITGVYRPEEGEIFFEGKPVILRSPENAFSLGIGVVHQERNLIPTFNVAENIFLHEIIGKPFSTVDRRGMLPRAREILDKLHLRIDPASVVDSLSSAQKQMVEIARALSVKTRLLVLDEPTASISLREADLLLDTVRALRDGGVSVIYVSHKLDEIFAVADRVKVIRDGRSIGDEIPIEELDKDSLIERMVGEREVLQSFPTRPVDNAQVVLEAKQLRAARTPAPNSFKLRKGEILGWYGLVGAGRTELAHAVIGVDPVQGGSLYVDGKQVSISSYREAFNKHGIYYLSENRKEEGLFLMHPICRNISIVALEKILGRGGLISYRKETELALKYKNKLNIKMPSPAAKASGLSGGNQQKVCIARCLVTSPRIIIVDEPTVGIDVRTKSEIHKLVYTLAGEGCSIILISSDLPEMIRLAGRIQVFREGRIVGEMENDHDYDVTSARVMQMMLDTVDNKVACE